MTARVRTVAALALLAPGAAAPAPAASAPPERPNLLVVMTDDQRADRTLTVMPRTRRLIARQGVTFADAHATTPSCCPSRASFFTGLYAHNHLVEDNFAAARLNHRLTVQHALRARGYRTGIFGKFLNHWPLERDPPFFDEWSITYGGFEDVEWNMDGTVRRSPRYTTDLIADRAARFIRRSERRDAQPWLAWVTPYAPHFPSTPARRHRGAPLPPFGSTPAIDERDYSDKPPFLDVARDNPALLEQTRDDGRRSLMAVDDMVGRLMAVLRRRGERRSTVVVFTSDNGLLAGEHGGLVGKDLPYPASTRVPLLVRWPGRLPAGRTRRDPVTNVDVATMLFRLGGARRPTDGRSLLARPARDTLFLESFGALDNDRRMALPPWRSVRTAGYQFTEYYDDGEVSFREYYDLRRDPWQLENAAATLSPARTASLARRLARLARCERRACP